MEAFFIIRHSGEVFGGYFEKDTNNDLLHGFEDLKNCSQIVLIVIVTTLRKTISIWKISKPKLMNFSAVTVSGRSPGRKIFFLLYISKFNLKMSKTCRPAVV